MSEAEAMRVLVIGTENRAGGSPAAYLAGQGHQVARATCAGAPMDGTPVDLREPGQVAPLLDSVEAIVYATPYTAGPAGLTGGDLLDYAARGAYVLLTGAVKAGVRRVVMISRLDLLAGYPEECVVSEHWRPLPDPSDEALAAYVSEITLREFCRVEEITGVVVRFPRPGEVEASTGFHEMNAVVERALTMDLTGRKYRWWLYHIGPEERYPPGAAGQPPLSFTRTPGGADAAGA